MFLPPNHQAAKLCSEASDDVQLMDASMKTLWDSLDEAAEVVSCPKINGLYRSAVWDDLCAELPGWLISLLVSCMTLSALLLLLVSSLLLLFSCFTSNRFDLADPPVVEFVVLSA